MNRWGDSLSGDDRVEDEPRQRRPRGRFRVTERGAAALAAYRAGVASAQASAGGRTALEEYQSAWASSQGVDSRDALVLEEIGVRPQAVAELGRALDDCGMAKTAIEGGIDRLSLVGLIELVTSPAS